MLVAGENMNFIKKLKEYGLPTEKRTYIIAEIGINHGGDLSLAKKLIDSAARAGVDAVKFQTYLTEKRAPKGNQVIFDILKQCELPFEAFGELKAHAEGRDVEFFSTPFDVESLEVLDGMGCALFKIASFDVVNHALLREVAAKGKSVIMSVGMAKMKEIQESYAILRQGTKSVALLHCMSAYPLKERDANLAAIYALKSVFDCVIGYSDHTPDIVVPLYAVAAGAQVIEKHYKIDTTMECVDAPVSITEAQMKKLVQETRRLEAMFGQGEFGVRNAEKDIEVFRRVTE